MRTIDTKNMDVVKCLEFAKKFMGGKEYQILPASEWQTLSAAELYSICAASGIYVVPTQELINKLDELIPEEENAIEVCSGLGIIGRALSMPTTDSRIQENPGFHAVMNVTEVMNVSQTGFKSGRQPIHYPDYIEKLEALEAVEKYHPDTVLVCYGTPKWSESFAAVLAEKGKDPHGFIDGVDYEELIKRVPRVIAVSNQEIMQNTICLTKEWCNRHGVKLVAHKAIGIFSSTGKSLTIYEWKRIKK